MMDNADIKAVIFDLDGTLIDTERFYRYAWPKAMKDLGYEMTEEQYLHMRSLGRPYSLEQFKAWYGEDFDYEQARRQRKIYFDECVAAEGIPRKKGAVEVLTYLGKQGVITAIATATDLDRAVEYLKAAGLYDYFTRVISAREVAVGKPSPDVYLYACRELGLDPANVIAVEDAPNGILSAYRAGCRVIMVPDQSPCEESLRPMLWACLENLG